MNKLVTFALRRGGAALLTLLGVSVVVFAAIHMIPGSFEEVLVPRGTPEFRQAVAERLGLDRPLPIQYLTWLGNLLQGDFGLSLVTSQPVWAEFSHRLPVTIEIALTATMLSIAIGMPVGIAAGLSGGRRGVATASRLFSGFTLSVPDFVIAGFFVYIFSKYTLGLTIGNWVPLAVDPVAHLRGLVLPAVTLSVPGIGIVAATARHATRAVLQQDYIMAAQLRGRSWRQVIARHVIRNASIPVVTVVSIFLGYLLGGTILVEMLYSIPGFGRYLFLGIQSRDYTVVQSGVMIAAAFFILLNMLTDIAYAWIDPRMRQQERA